MEGKLVSAYILKIKLESFTGEKLNITLATGLKSTRALANTCIMGSSYFDSISFCFHGNTWP